MTLISSQCLGTTVRIANDRFVHLHDFLTQSPTTESITQKRLGHMPTTDCIRPQKAGSNFIVIIFITIS